MPRRNRVDPWGDLCAVADRGHFTGNRGCVVDDDERVVRHHAGPLWITCTLRYRDHRSPLAAAHRWTPLFFLDDAVALAAGHRPCALCRRPAYHAYRVAVGLSLEAPSPLRSTELDRRLGAERLRRGRGLDRASDRITWRAPFAELPDGTVVIDRDGTALLVRGDQLRSFTFAGWGPPSDRPTHGMATVLTPPTSYAALTFGFEPWLAL
ncbi:MAG TPA: hypothetical protein VIT41_19095 [Microlunatus sp.]